MLVTILFTGIPGVNFNACAQGISPGLSATSGAAVQGNSVDTGQVRMISIDDLNALMKSGTDLLLVDARSREQYYMAHIPGAISMPLNEIQQYAGSIDRNRMIVTYCGNYHCPISTKAAVEFARLGFSDVQDYKGGIKEWQEMGYATAAGNS